MKTITLTDDLGATTEYLLREGWHELNVLDFLDHQATQQLHAARQLVAQAALVSTVPASILSEDVSVAAAIVAECGWLSELPPAGEPLTTFEHAGTRYEHVGNLDKISAGQLEALLDYLKAGADNPVAAFPELLAVLYTPTGRTQTSDVVEATARAFRSLPLTTAWPALAFFLTSSSASALRIQQYLAAKNAASQAILKLRSLAEEAIAGGSLGFLRRWQWRATARWTKYAERMLRTF